MAKDAEAGGQGASGKSFIIVVALVAIIGGIAGGLYAMLAIEPMRAKTATAVASAGHGEAEAMGSRKVHASEPSDTSPPSVIVAMDPIHVSLVGAKERWLRLDASVVFAGKESGDHSAMSKHIAEDMALYLRTVSLEQIDSASGMEYLREDLSELARLRSKGGARGILLRALMVE